MAFGSPSFSNFQNLFFFLFLFFFSWEPRYSETSAHCSEKLLPSLLYFAVLLCSGHVWSALQLSVLFCSALQFCYALTVFGLPWPALLYFALIISVLLWPFFCYDIATFALLMPFWFCFGHLCSLQRKLISLRWIASAFFYIAYAHCSENESRCSE